ncbi:MAG TPA: peptide chain release factor 2 [Blastocatellia bacterium]|nr:peptide chain release factor 2 [Blastocatellia bacterium]
MIEELREKYEELSARAGELRGFFDPESKRAEIARLEEETAKPEFWQDQENAQKVLKRRSRLESALEKADRFEREMEDASVLIEFAAEDEASLGELESVLARLEEEIRETQTEMLLSGPNDARDAIVTINAGAGGTDAQDWAEMLLRMYLRWAERHGFKTEIIDEQPGKEAGIKSATFTVSGEYAYGLLSAEAGVHRLVRLSPFNAGSSRETSFASVFVYPDIEEDVDIEIQDKDLRVDTYRSSGAGGQHVNVTDSAVRITHLPTGIVVTCQNQRSQHQNREVAMRILKSRLYEIEMEKRRSETAQLEESKRDISFGSQIRNYVLHPYRLVKDVRTKYETSDVDSVLDGDIEEFIRQYLTQKSRAA